MEISPINILLNRSKENLQRAVACMPNNRLKADKFVRNVAFKGGYMKHSDLANSTSTVKSAAHYLQRNIANCLSEGDKLQNYYSRKLLNGALPKAIDKLKTVDLNTNETILEALIKRGDDLKLPLEKDNLNYINSKINTSLSELSPKELAYILVSRNPDNTATTGSEIIKYLNTKKTQVPSDKYEQILTDVITGAKKHVNDVIPELKPLQDVFTTKLLAVENLIKDNAKQETIARNLDYLRNVGQRKIFVNELSDNEFGFFLLTDMYRIPAQNPNQTFTKILKRIKEFMPDEIYNKMLIETMEGKRDSNKIIQLMLDSPKNSWRYNKFDCAQWTDHVLSNTKS